MEGVNFGGVVVPTEQDGLSAFATCKAVRLAAWQRCLTMTWHAGNIEPNLDGTVFVVDLVTRMLLGGYQLVEWNRETPETPSRRGRRLRLAIGGPDR